MRDCPDKLVTEPKCSVLSTLMVFPWNNIHHIADGRRARVRVRVVPALGGLAITLLTFTVGGDLVWVTFG